MLNVIYTASTTKQFSRKTHIWLYTTVTLTDKLPKHFKDSMEEMKKSLTAISEGFCLTSKGSGLLFRNERYMSDYDETFKAVLLYAMYCTSEMHMKSFLNKLENV